MSKEIELLIQAQKELDALWSLVGNGLEVANWHLNGDLEPLDNFFMDSNHGALDAINEFLNSFPKDIDT